MREDIHKPSLLDPAEYKDIACFYQGSSNDMYWSYRYEMDEYAAALEQYPVFQGNHAAKGTCDHCGAAFAHGVLFLHEPTGEVVHIGHICAANTVGLPSKAAKIRKDAEKYAKEQKAHRKQMEATQEWRDENEELVTWLNSLENPHDFLYDMIKQINKWGKLSPNQTAATYKWMAGAAKRAEQAAEAAERLSNVSPVRDGRQTLIGTILSTKWKPSPYGDQLKMLVELPDGNKVYGTMPKSLRALMPEKGAEVRFTATVQRSNDDEHFGFFSKPTNAEVI